MNVKHLETVDKEKAKDLLTNLTNSHFLIFFHFLVDLMAVVSGTSRHFQRNDIMIADVSQEIEGVTMRTPITQNNKW